MATKYLEQCLEPLTKEDRAELEKPISELFEAFGENKHNAKLKELTEIIISVVGKLPLNSGPSYFTPLGYVKYSMKFASYSLVNLRDILAHFNLPLKAREEEILTLKLFTVIVAFSFNLRILASSILVVADNGDEFGFEEPFTEWLEKHKGQGLKVYQNVGADWDDCGAKVLTLIINKLPDWLKKLFYRSCFKYYLSDLQKYINGDYTAIRGRVSVMEVFGYSELILKDQIKCKFARIGERSPPHVHAMIIMAVCSLFAEELSGDETITVEKKQTLPLYEKKVESFISAYNGKFYIVVDNFLPLLKNKLNKMFPRRLWTEPEVLKGSCEAGFLDLKENETFTEVPLTKDIWKKGGITHETLVTRGILIRNLSHFVPKNSEWSRVIQSVRSKANNLKGVVGEDGKPLPNPIARQLWNEKNELICKVAEKAAKGSDPRESEERVQNSLKHSKNIQQSMAVASKNLDAKKAAQKEKEETDAPAVAKQKKADKEYEAQQRKKHAQQYKSDYQMKHENSKKSSQKQATPTAEQVSNAPANAHESQTTARVSDGAEQATSNSQETVSEKSLKPGMIASLLWKVFGNSVTKLALANGFALVASEESTPVNAQATTVSSEEAKGAAQTPDGSAKTASETKISEPQASALSENGQEVSATPESKAAPSAESTQKSHAAEESSSSNAHMILLQNHATTVSFLPDTVISISVHPDTSSPNGKSQAEVSAKTSESAQPSNAPVSETDQKSAPAASISAPEEDDEYIEWDARKVENQAKETEALKSEAPKKTREKLVSVQENPEIFSLNRKASTGKSKTSASSGTPKKTQAKTSTAKSTSGAEQKAASNLSDSCTSEKTANTSKSAAAAQNSSGNGTGNSKAKAKTNKSSTANVPSSDKAVTKAKSEKGSQATETKAQANQKNSDSSTATKKSAKSSPANAPSANTPTGGKVSAPAKTKRTRKPKSSAPVVDLDPTPEELSEQTA